MSGPRAPTLWLDVGDLIHYLTHHSRPSGIQRVTFELCRALHRLDNGAGRVQLVQRDGGPRDIVTVEWTHLDTLFKLAIDPPMRACTLDDGTPPPEGGAAMAMPPDVAADLTDASAGHILTAVLSAQWRVLAALGKLPVRIVAQAGLAVRRRLRIRHARGRRPGSDEAPSRAIVAPPQGTYLRSAASPGDSFVVLGSPWAHRDYVQTVRWVRDDLRMRFALLMYDIIPVRRPEWCDRGLISMFVEWHQSVLPLADQVFAISRSTAADVGAWAHESKFTLSNGIQAVPMGTGLDHHADASSAGVVRAARLPPVGSYVLFVSTLEARKNHVLLFRLWRRLLADLTRDRVPILVFAGRVGWLVADLVQQLENAGWLDGKIRLISGPTDAELMELYRGCQFTLFPSFYEGWGLPVSESLALGRPCIAANRTSLPEAGGDLARYFDPDSLDDAYRVVRAALDDPAGLEAWRARVASEFRVVSWDRSAEVIRSVLDALDSAT